MSENVRPVRQARSGPWRYLTVAAWAFLAVLAVILGWLSLHACSLAHLFPGLSPGYCQVDLTVAVSEADLQRAQIQELRREIDEMERSLLISPNCETSHIGDLNCPPVDVSEVTVIIDASASMELCSRLPDAAEQHLGELYEAAFLAVEDGDFEEAGRLRQEASDLERAHTCTAPDRRFDVARRALGRYISQAPESTVITATTLGSCEQPANSIGRFEADNRGDLLGSVQSLQIESNTPITATLRSLTESMVGGETPDEPVSIIVISDGGDNCTGANACEAARELKARRPYATINVVTIGGDPFVGLCIAEATGGNVYDAREPGEFSRALRQAAGEVAPEGCPRG